MKARLALAAVGFALGVQPAAADPSGFTSLAFGGVTPCVQFESVPAVRDRAISWIAGYWSGLNGSSDTPNTGQSTTLAGIIAEIDLVCRAEPSRTVAWATLQVYQRLADEDR